MILQRALFVAAAATAINVMEVQHARAATCASAPIQAKGEEARYLWLAKMKARGNWRVKVRNTPGLGQAYATWSRAENTDENCLSGPKNHLCIFTGTPCTK